MKRNIVDIDFLNRSQVPINRITCCSFYLGVSQVHIALSSSLGLYIRGGDLGHSLLETVAFVICLYAFIPFDVCHSSVYVSGF